MIERVRLAGGTLRIDSGVGRGTRVSAELLLAPTQDYKPAVEQPVLT
jgi:hypothetical protein